MKQCTKCKIEKPFEMFAKASKHKDGLRYECRACTNQTCKEYYEVHKAAAQKRSLDYYHANKEQRAEYTKKYYLQHRKHKSEYNRKYQKEYYPNNKATIFSNIRKRSLSKIQRTPSWLSDGYKFEMGCIYTYANALNSVGLHYHVDHIIPLQGEQVSGLHTPDNLQVITAEENLRKGNRYNDQAT